MKIKAKLLRSTAALAIMKPDKQSSNSKNSNNNTTITTTATTATTFVQEWPNATNIRKFFPGLDAYFEGYVESFDPETGYYFCTYEDGDQEDLDAKEMNIVVSNAQAQAKAQTKASAAKETKQDNTLKETVSSRGRRRKVTSYAEYDDDDFDDDEDMELEVEDVLSDRPTKVSKLSTIYYVYRQQTFQSGTTDSFQEISLTLFFYPCAHSLYSLHQKLEQPPPQPQPQPPPPTEPSRKRHVKSSWNFPKYPRPILPL